MIDRFIVFSLFFILSIPSFAMEDELDAVLNGKHRFASRV